MFGLKLGFIFVVLMSVFTSNSHARCSEYGDTYTCPISAQDSFTVTIEDLSFGDRCQHQLIIKDKGMNVNFSFRSMANPPSRWAMKVKNDGVSYSLKEGQKTLKITPPEGRPFQCEGSWINESVDYQFSENLQNYTVRKGKRKRLEIQIKRPKSFKDALEEKQRKAALKKFKKNKRESQT